MPIPFSTHALKGILIALDDYVVEKGVGEKEGEDAKGAGVKTDLYCQ